MHIDLVTRAQHSVNQDVLRRVKLQSALDSSVEPVLLVGLGGLALCVHLPV